MRRAFSAAGSRREAEADVALDGQPGEHAALLEDEDPAGVGSFHRLTVDRHAARRGRHESADDVQERGLSAPGRPEDAHELSLAYVERHVVQDGDFVAVRPKGLRKAVDPDLRAYAPSPLWGEGRGQGLFSQSHDATAGAGAAPASLAASISVYPQAIALSARDAS